MDLLIPGFGLMVWTLISFLILFFILKKFAWKFIITTLNDREEKINESISSAEKMKNEMLNLKSENEILLNKAKEERNEILKEAKNKADTLIAEAKTKAKIEFDKILQDAQESIKQQKNAAIIDVKNQAGNIIVEISEKILQRELNNKKEQENFISTLVSDMKFN